MENYSPLRYPGGKSALYPAIANIIESNNMKHCIYIEPFAGGANIAWSLLINGIVDYIIINDADKSIYSFWRAITESTHWFIEKIESVSVTVDEWRKQRAILQESSRYSKELGFAMFFLNRTNRSGILDAGPIGGYDQSGTYKIDCRFNKASLIKKISKIAEYKKNVKIYNQDISVFLLHYLPRWSDKGEIFIYFDPPYYEKGQRLYMNYLSGEDHERLRDAVSSLDCKWVMTYDDNIEIDKLYEHYQRFHFSVNYSLANKKKGGELMIFKDSSCIPSAKIIKNLPKTISFDSDSINLEENKMSVCRFCSIANKGDFLQKPENKIIAETNDYFAISSVGALVEGWTLIVPKKHCCSMKALYSEKQFAEFTSNVIEVLEKCYGPVIAFEHGPNREGSATSCGTNHAHIHLVPYHSLIQKLDTIEFDWQICTASQVDALVGNNEYLFYCEPIRKWDNPNGRVHILKEPISQFFRKVIAEDQGNIEKYNYKTNPDTTLTLKTIKKLVRDKIPEKIEKNGEEAVTAELNKELFSSLLKRKLVEEALEVLDSKNDEDIIAELADILEVLDGILSQYQIDFNTVLSQKEIKRKKSGGFDKGIYLKKTTSRTASGEGRIIVDKAPVDTKQGISKSTDWRRYPNANESLTRIKVPVTLDKWEVRPSVKSDNIDIVLRGERKQGVWQVEISVFEEADQLSFFDK